MVKKIGSVSAESKQPVVSYLLKPLRYQGHLLLPMDDTIFVALPSTSEALPGVISAIADSVTAGVAIFALLYGTIAWRVQKRSERMVAVCESVIEATYTGKDFLRTAQSIVAAVNRVYIRPIDEGIAGVTLNPQGVRRLRDDYQALWERAVPPMEAALRKTEAAWGRSTIDGLLAGFAGHQIDAATIVKHTLVESQQLVEDHQNGIIPIATVVSEHRNTLSASWGHLEAASKGLQELSEIADRRIEQEFRLTSVEKLLVWVRCSWESTAPTRIHASEICASLHDSQTHRPRHSTIELRRAKREDRLPRDGH